MKAKSGSYDSPFCLGKRCSLTYRNKKVSYRVQLGWAVVFAQAAQPILYALCDTVFATRLGKLAESFEVASLKASSLAQELANIALELRSKQFELDIMTHLRTLGQGVKMRFRNAKYALVVVGNLEKSIFTRTYVNNLATLDDIVWLEGSQQYSSVGLLENVRYVKNGACKKGTLQMVQVGDDIFLIELKCFPAGTLVHTPTGTKPIEQIRADDVVKSYDEATQMNTWQRVVGAFQKTTEKLVRIITGKDTLFATPEHPFYAIEEIPDASRIGSWLPASSLRNGLKVLLATGLLATVESTFAFDTIATVYNFEVDRTHTYYVGNQGILVHNAYIANKFPNEAIPTDGYWYNVKIEDGIMKSYRNSTVNLSTEHDFVITKYGEMKIGFRHQFLASNQEVWAAGQVVLENGRVKIIKNLSGHYQPTVTEAETFPELFRGVGLEVSGAELQLYNIITISTSNVVGLNVPVRIIRIP